MSEYISKLKESSAIVDAQNELINKNIKERAQWEDECKAVMLSYRGNKFPSLNFKRGKGEATGTIGKDKNKEVFVNLIKRQYRVTSNYLLNNEPTYLITKTRPETEESDLVATREWLDRVFNGQQVPQGDEEEEGAETNFHDTDMDDVIFYGMFRGVVWTIAYYDDKSKIYGTKTYDSLDTFIDLDSRNLRGIQKIIITYTKDKNELKDKYPNDGFGVPIAWDKVNTDQEKSVDDAKKSMLLDQENSNSLIVREGYYLEYEGGKKVVYRVLTTKTQFLERKKIPKLNFIPATPFTPTNDPDEKFPRGWYVDMVVLEREINELIGKLNTIVKTGGRYVYVKAGTVLTKWNSNLLNKLGIEVIEVADSQALPQQAQLLTMSSADLQWMDFLMRQAEDEGGMKQDIMGNSSTGTDASGRAIQALQAGSKNNIGTALNELNKYMNRLVRMMIRLHNIYGDDTTDVYSDKYNTTLKLNKESMKGLNVKVSVTWRDAFDEITKQLNAIQLLDYIVKFNPDIKIDPEVITAIFGVSNDIADDIQKSLDKQEDPDMQIAEGENKKFMQWVQINANATDNHPVHIAMHSALLQNLDLESEAGKRMIDHLNMHDAFEQASVQ